MNTDVITKQVEEHVPQFEKAQQQVNQVILGQETLVERLFMSLIAEGHVLIEGLPGLAKTLTAQMFATVTGSRFKRVQFTPDLLPADLLGTSVYNPKEANFFIHKGPLFTNILLADEINRAPPKVQSALLEVMQERQITIGGKTFQVKRPYLVLATQNPIELEGTYPLPEAQTDRFLMHVIMSYPPEDEELKLLNTIDTLTYAPEIDICLTPEKIIETQKIVEGIFVDMKVIQYIYSLLDATRQPEKYGIDKMKGWLLFGASPRAGLALKKAAQAYAFMRGRGYVTPDDVKEVVPDVLRHRLRCSYEAEAEGINADGIIKLLLSHLKVF